MAERIQQGAGGYTERFRSQESFIAQESFAETHCIETESVPRQHHTARIRHMALLETGAEPPQSFFEENRENEKALGRLRRVLALGITATFACVGIAILGTSKVIALLGIYTVLGILGITIGAAGYIMFKPTLKRWRRRT